MTRVFASILGVVVFTTTACSRFNVNEGEVQIPDFNFPKTLVFEDSLSAYTLFDGVPSELTPAMDVQLLELSSVLYSDYAYKQRLVKLPGGTQMVRLSDGTLDFPDGTILTKTFFYYNDERDRSQGKRIIETRLEIKENNIWNVATYIWNQAQTEAILTLDGLDTEVSWINENGQNISTLYHVPTENECMTCHQSNSEMAPLGPTLRNMNRSVERNGVTLNQLSHLQSVGVLNDFDITQAPTIVNYKDAGVSLSERGRAYLALNCAHCHNPNGWEEPAGRDYDFRYDTPLNQSGLLFESEKIIDAVQSGEMPFIGTTIIDQEGVDLVVEYINSL